MQYAKDAGIQAVNGLMMLAAQAVKAQNIWQGKVMPDGLTRYIKNQLSQKKGNLVLIGMPDVGNRQSAECCRTNWTCRFWIWMKQSYHALATFVVVRERRIGISGERNGDCRGSFK